MIRDIIETTLNLAPTVPGGDTTLGLAGIAGLALWGAIAAVRG